MSDESEVDWIKDPSFIVCAGISFYEALNFFTFLFFNLLSKEDIGFLKVAWTVHNFTFVILCGVLGYALYKSVKKQAVSTYLQ